MEIVLLKPKDLEEKAVALTLSERTARLLQFYSEYCKRNQDDIVDHYLEEIFRLDQKFQAWGTSITRCFALNLVLLIIHNRCLFV